MVDLIDIKRIEDIVVKAHFQATKFEKDPTNARAKEQFLSRVQELAELVEASSYPSTWILKPLPEAPKPPQSGGNGTSLTGTAPTGTAPAGVTAGSFFGDTLHYRTHSCGATSLVEPLLNTPTQEKLECKKASSHLINHHP
jgi:hypothetical protein